MPLFGKKKPEPHLDRQTSLQAKPVLNRLVKLERGEDGNVILHVPRPDTWWVRWVTGRFKLPAYKRVALDELGSFVIEHCDGTQSVRDVVDKFAEKYKLNRREAEVSMNTFLRDLARRSIIGFVIEDADA
jgi:Coenzyme PQQ synthesis protein D (PqqD)